MTGKTNPVGKETLDRFNGVNATAWSDPVYVNLLTAGPSSDGEPGSYPTNYVEWEMARVPVYRSTTSASEPRWSSVQKDSAAPGKVYISNQHVVSWGEISGVGTAVTVTHIAVFTTAGAASGNLLYWDELDVSRTVNDGDTFQFGVNKLKIRED